MNVVAFVIALVFGLMLAENRLSRANAGWLKDHGAVSPPGDVFVTLAVLYPAAFLLMGAEGLWRAATISPQVEGGPMWAASGALMFAASKALKYWAIRSLGRRWSFRVFVLPGQPLVTAGPYRYVAHPNYIAVVGELVGLEDDRALVVERQRLALRLLRHFAAIVLAHDALLDRGQILLVQEMEVHRAVLDGGVHLHRHLVLAEHEVAFPDGADAHVSVLRGPRKGSWADLGKTRAPMRSRGRPPSRRQMRARRRGSVELARVEAAAPVSRPASVD